MVVIVEKIQLLWQRTS